MQDWVLPVIMILFCIDYRWNGFKLCFVDATLPKKLIQNDKAVKEAYHIISAIREGKDKNSIDVFVFIFSVKLLRLRMHMSEVELLELLCTAGESMEKTGKWSWRAVRTPYQNGRQLWDRGSPLRHWRDGGHRVWFWCDCYVGRHFWW